MTSYRTKIQIRCGREITDGTLTLMDMGRGGGGSKSQAWGNDPRTIPERKHPLVGLGNTRGAFGQVDNCSFRIRLSKVKMQCISVDYNGNAVSTK